MLQWLRLGVQSLFRSWLHRCVNIDPDNGLVLRHCLDQWRHRYLLIELSWWWWSWLVSDFIRTRKTFYRSWFYSLFYSCMYFTYCTLSAMTTIKMFNQSLINSSWISARFQISFTVRFGHLTLLFDSKWYVSDTEVYIGWNFHSVSFVSLIYWVIWFLESYTDPLMMCRGGGLGLSDKREKLHLKTVKVKGARTPLNL